MEALLEGEGEKITRKAIEMALAGDTIAMRLCIDRLLPVRKDRPIKFDLPKLQTAGDVVEASAALVSAAAAGEITLSEAGELSRLIEGFTKALDLHEIQQRLEKLEAAQSSGARRWGGEHGVRMRSRTTIRRIERLEASRPQAYPPCHQVILEPGEDKGVRIAALVATGEAKEGDTFMVIQIVDPPREHARRSALITRHAPQGRGEPGQLGCRSPLTFAEPVSTSAGFNREILYDDHRVVWPFEHERRDGEMTTATTVVALPLHQQIAVAFYDGAWQVRAYGGGRRGPACSFASREEALAYAWSLGCIITQSTNISGLKIKLTPLKEPEVPWGYRQAPGAW
jgi:hypothetical protein